MKTLITVKKQLLLFVALVFFSIISTMNGQSNTCNFPGVAVIGQAGTTTYSSSISALPSEVIIRGQLVIDQTFYSISNTILHMDEGSEIFVAAGKQLFVSGSVSFTGCQKMWKGIYVDGALFFAGTNQSIVISDAERGVAVSYLSTQAIFTGCSFSKNIKDIVYPIGQISGDHIIYDNVFTGGSSLLPAYSGQLNHSSFSTNSLEFISCNFISITSNEIEGYQVGIHSAYSILNIYDNIITEISDAALSVFWSNYIMDNNSIGGAKSNYGIFSYGCGFDIKNDNRIGTNLITAPNLLAAAHFSQSLPFVNGQFSNVENNNFEIQFAGGVAKRIIQLWNNTNEIKVRRNTLRGQYNHCNFIELENTTRANIYRNNLFLPQTEKYKGVSLVNSSINQVCYNDIRLYGGPTIGNTYGIYSENGSGTNTFTRNKIHNDFIGPNTGTFGIENNNCTNSIGCNKLDQLQYGLRVLGACSGSNIHTNRFNSGSVGLYYNNIAETGAQSLTGNLWKIGGHTLGGQHDGSQAQVQLSLYYIDMANNNSTPPVGYTYNPVVNVSGWFQNSLEQKATPICDEPLLIAEIPESGPELDPAAVACGTLVPLAPTDTGLIRRMAAGELGSELPAGSYNILQRQLYRNMKSTGDHVNSAIATQLYNTYEQGVIAQFEQTRLAVEEVLELNSNLLASFKANNLLINQKMNALSQIDKLGGAASSPQRAVLCNDIAALTPLWRQHLQQIQQEKIAKANAALLLIASLPEAQQWMQNEKSAYQIYLNYVISDQKPESADRLLLKNIASHCVSQGGHGVTAARSMYYALFQDSFDGTCEDVILPRVNEMASNTDFQVYPNPANAMIRITLPALSTSSDKIEIIDNSGKYVKTVNITENQLVVDTDVSKLESGLYFVKYSGVHYSIVKKFIKIAE